MAMKTFIWCPRVNASGSIMDRTLVAQFGDGYQQAAADGINTQIETWPISFIRRMDKMQPIIDFLDSVGQWEAFLWTSPAGKQGAYRRGEYSLIPMGAGLYSLSVTLNKVYTP